MLNPGSFCNHLGDELLTGTASKPSLLGGNTDLLKLLKTAHKHALLCRWEHQHQAEIGRENTLEPGAGYWMLRL